MEPVVDSNNNAAVGKYSLRPRTSVKRSPEDSCQEEVQKQRSRTKRKLSQRSLPLSKYRRKSANARERSRMREINEAFETLRKVVSWRSDNQGEKTTKISTLRLAMKYIAALSDALQESGAESGDDSHQGQRDSSLNFLSRSVVFETKQGCNEQLVGFTDFSNSQRTLSFVPSTSEPLRPLSMIAANLTDQGFNETSLDVQGPTLNLHQLGPQADFSPSPSCLPQNNTCSLVNSSCELLVNATAASSLTVGAQCDSLCNVSGGFKKVKGSFDLEPSSISLVSTCHSTEPISNFSENFSKASNDRQDLLPFTSRPSLQESSPISCFNASQFEQCSSNVCEEVENLPFQPLLFEELFIT